MHEKVLIDVKHNCVSFALIQPYFYKLCLRQKTDRMNAAGYADYDMIMV